MIDFIANLYKIGLVYGLITSAFFMVFFFVVGTIRWIKRYAYAQPMIHSDHDDASDCSFVLRIAWTLEAFFENKDFRQDEQIMKPIGALMNGVGLDVLLSGALFLLTGLLWPVVFPVVIIWLPLQSMHNHHHKKKEFLKKLQGEKAEA